VNSIYETQHRLWCEQLEYVLYSQGPVDELTLRVAAGAYIALCWHRVDRHGRCRHCCRSRSGGWFRQRHTCTVYLTFSVAMNQPIKMVRGWLEDH